MIELPWKTVYGVVNEYVIHRIAGRASSVGSIGVGCTESSLRILIGCGSAKSDCVGIYSVVV